MESNKRKNGKGKVSKMLIIMGRKETKEGKEPVGWEKEYPKNEVDIAI
jgi:hypothetical protein